MFHLCNRFSSKKYSVFVIFTNEIEKNCVYVSESMKFNITNHLNLKNSNSSTGYFLVAADRKFMSFASEMKISLIFNPYDSTNNLINILLQNYFSTPKYLRVNDIFTVDIKNHAPEIKYSTSDSKVNVLHFKVKSLKAKENDFTVYGSFIVYGQTTLIQETHIHSYLPQKCLCQIYLNNQIHSSGSWPPALKESLNQLQSCIAPFMQNSSYINIKPIFLVEGSNGSGKRRLIKTAAKSLGLHFLEADLAEVQSLSSAQTEAKLRIILHNAETCVPCLLMLQNIQIFGVNAEGQKDERVLATFESYVNKLYSEKSKYPVIIVATSTDSEIPIDVDRTFVEKIVIAHLKQEQRSEILSWHMKRKGIKYDVDLQKVAAICSDFALADLEALVMHTTKRLFHSKDSFEGTSLVLSTEDFNHAIEHMQSAFSDQIGAPRVPKVHWEDIGGLADLKREITRRIEMPLLMNVTSGLGRSGLLLYGPPGTGKTLLAKAVATECQLHFLSVKGPELLNMYVGQSEKNVRQVFARARAAAPCIIFFDELDSLAPKRGQSGDSGGVMDRVVSQLLAEMDGLENAGGVFIVGATNRPDLLDPALLRPGRFDRMLYVGVYAEPESQLGVLRALTRRFNLEEHGEELKKLLAELPENLTGADLYSVCSGAWLRAVRRLLTHIEPKNQETFCGQDVVVKLEDLLCASKDLVPSVSKEELLRYEKLRNELLPVR
ncbi:peroxisome assembly factor 2 [Copidosoma floridanum]|uniref:peroxisome assembly factor 2 n=1 Tax=Copidosoma floridanum TaxID=29053 RepID=UPI0006C96C69|nr:peroxisome assembly factor 2 [Copidosoma floridanum]